MSQPILAWIQEWYERQCNGDWGGGFRVHINTVDNPGWHVSVGLSKPTWKDSKLFKLEERSESGGPLGRLLQSLRQRNPSPVRYLVIHTGGHDEV